MRPQDATSNSSPPPPLPARSRSVASIEHFPMTAMPTKTLMTLDRLLPFHECWDRGYTRQNLPSNAVITFISHQWLSYTHPDPHSQQLAALKHVLSKIMDGKAQEVMDGDAWETLAKNKPRLQADDVSPSSRRILDSHQDAEGLTPESLADVIANGYVWLDYFSIPQDTISIHAGVGEVNQNEQQRAIMSLPYYVERSAFFFVLAPSCMHADSGEVCDVESWRKRGWCRLEGYSNYLSIKPMAPLFITDNGRVSVEHLEDFFVHVANTREGAVCAGDFTCCRLKHRSPDGQADIPCDKHVCVEVLEKLWSNKHAYGQAQDSLAIKCATTIWSAHIFTRDISEPWTGGPLLQKANASDRMELFKQSFTPFSNNPANLLTFSAQMGCPQLVQELLDDSCDVGAFDGLGRTPLHCACIPGCEEVVDMLIGRAQVPVQEFVNMPNQKTEVTPLMRAAQQGHIRIVSRLLECRADPLPFRKDTGDTALHLAVSFGRVDCVHALLKIGADVHARNLKGRTPLFLAADSATIIGSYRGKLEAARILLEAKAEIHARDDNGQTALQLAEAHSHDRFLQLCGWRSGWADAVLSFCTVS